MAKTKLIVQDAAVFEDMPDNICGIQRGLDEITTGKGEAARKVLERVREKHRIPPRSR